MATFNAPKQLLLDEHKAALDSNTANKILQITDQIIEENHLTALMVTHNINDVIKHGNRLIMMDIGQIILDISGEKKRNLSVEILLKKFKEISLSSISDDKEILI